MYKYILLLLLIGNIKNVNAQQLSYSDPATAYLRILLEKGGEGANQQIGNFKVAGTSFLFGQKLKGDAYTPTEKALNTLISYNTYNQQLEVYQDNSVKPLVKTVKDLDSFRLIASSTSDFKEDLLFLNSGLLDSSKKFFVQQVATGSRFSLYKAYKSTMGYVSTNYIQSDLRQFDLNYDYYYKDATKPGLKKLKITAGNLKKEFKDVKDISALADDDGLDKNTEYVLKQIFAALNY